MGGLYGGRMCVARELLPCYVAMGEAGGVAPLELVWLVHSTRRSAVSRLGRDRRWESLLLWPAGVFGPPVLPCSSEHNSQPWAPPPTHLSSLCKRARP